MQTLLFIDFEILIQTSRDLCGRQQIKKSDILMEKAKIKST